VVEKNTKEQSQESKSLEKQESGFPSSGNSTSESIPQWDSDSWGMLQGYNKDRCTKEENDLRRDWRAYNWDRLIAKSTLDHQDGYMSEDKYGICIRTIKKCEMEMKLIIERIKILREVESE